MSTYTFLFVTTWTLTDQVKALAQGWGVWMNTTTGRPEIWRDDETEIFPDDAAAVAYVRDRAKHGDMLAHTALEITDTPLA